MQDQQDPDTLSQAKCPRTLEDTASAIEDLPGLEAVPRDQAASTWRGSTIQHSHQVRLLLAGCCLLVTVCMCSCTLGSREAGSQSCCLIQSQRLLLHS